MEINRLTIHNSNEIARIHLISFPNFFLSSFGEYFLNIFYKAIIKDKDSINIGIFEREQLIGFAIGSINNKSFYKKLILNNILELGLAALIPLIKKPKNLLRLYRSLVTKSITDNDLINAGILLSICINPLNESKGNGKILLNEFEKIVFKAKEAIVLTTDADNNKYVNNFYFRNEYVLKSQFNQGHRKMNLYIKYR
jgi:hypothetical protein